MSNEPLKKWKVSLRTIRCFMMSLPNAKAVIDTRNRIIHGYDSVKPEFLWSLVIRHIPELKKDIERIIAEYGISSETIG